MRKVLVFGTFDVLHPGHISFFQQARKYGDYLIVVIGRDDVTKKIKGKLPYFNERERLAMLRNVFSVDRVVLGDKLGETKIVMREKPDVICWGYDQKMNAQIPFDLACLKTIKQVRLRAYKPHKYASSKIIKRKHKK